MFVITNTQKTVGTLMTYFLVLYFMTLSHYLDYTVSMIGWQVNYDNEQMRTNIYALRGVRLSIQTITAYASDCTVTGTTCIYDHIHKHNICLAATIN
jgi:hypothetical protein